MKETEKIDFGQYASNYQYVMDKHLRPFSVKPQKVYEYKIKLVKRLTNIEPKKILDYGCGVGSNISYLKRFFPQSQIFGTDISAESLNIAKKNHPKAVFFKNDLARCDESYDLIFIAGVLHYIPIRQR